MTGIITAVFASSGAWSIILYLLQRRDNRKSADRKALIALLHDRIYEKCESAIIKGSITMSDFEALSYLYESYEKLGATGQERRYMTMYRNSKKMRHTRYTISLQILIIL